jgi:hypothetical protein
MPTQLSSSASKLIFRQAGTSKLDSFLDSSELFFVTTLHGPAQETQLLCWEDVFTALLHSNRGYLIVACVFVAAGVYLLSRCLAVNIYFDFTIPAFGRHFTME